MKRQIRVFLFVLLWLFAWATVIISPASASLGPYVQNCSVMADNTPSGMKKGFDIIVVDPDGSVPASISSVTVSGPGGFSYAFVAADYQGGTSNEYWHAFDGLPANGEYTFTVTNSGGKTAQCHYSLTVGQTIPIPDTSTFQASGTDPLTPTLSWSTIPGYEGNLFYRARIYDAGGTRIWSQNLAFNTTSVNVPSGVLTSGQTYSWRVEAMDNFNYYNANNRARPSNISLKIDNTHPFFTTVGAFLSHNPDDTFATVFFAQGANPAGTVSSLVVTDPNGIPHSFPSLSCFTASGTCNLSLPGPTTDGLYTFTVTNSDNNTATSYFYFESFAVPSVDSSTMHASGSALTPVLSWNAPAAVDRPLYSYVFVRDALSQTTVWSDWTLGNAISVPLGKLQTGVSYEWRMVANDSSFFASSNRAVSPWKALAVDNASPFFWYAILYDRHEPDGNFTGVNVSVRDRRGAFPGNLASLTVSGPNGFSYAFKPEDYYPSDNEFYQRLPGAPEEGLYTFTLTDNNGTSAVTHAYHRRGAGTIPLLDDESLQVSGDPLAPTISWGMVADYPYHLNYRVRIVDEWGNQAFATSAPFWPTGYQVVPSGRLSAGPTYRYRVEAMDERYLYACDNRVTTGYHTFGVPSISGRVTNSQGNGIPNVTVQAYDAATGVSKPTVPTDQDGYYRMSNLPSGNYKLFFSGSGYFSQWFNAKTSQNTADPVTVAAPTLTSGVDVVLEPSGGISGTVRNELGVGIAYVNVQVCYPNGYVLSSGQTNSSGSYTVSNLPTGSYKVRFLAPLGYKSEWYNNKASQDAADLVAVTLPSITSGIDAVLEPGGSIAGTVKNGQGTVVANVDVWVYDLGGWWMAGARTNQSGAYTANGLPAGSYRVQFKPPSTSSYCSEWYNDKSKQGSADPVVVSVPNVTSGIDAVLEQGGSISGAVTNGQGVGIGNVQVQLFDAADTNMSASKATVTTGQDGGYTFSNLASGNYRLFFSADGYYSEWYNSKISQSSADPVAVNAPSPTSGINVVLAQSGGISGVVTNGAGVGIWNVWVGVSDATGYSLGGASTRQDGSYTISGLATGTYKVRFNAPTGYLSEWFNDQVTQEAANPVTVTLPNITSGVNAVLQPGGSISGTVTNEQGTGMANVQVQVHDLYGMWAAGAMTNQNGVYTANGLPAGTYKVYFSPSGDEGYGSEWYNNKDNEGSADPVVVTVPQTTSGIDAVLEQGGKLSGRVRNGAGAGIANVQVQIYDAADTTMNAPRVTVTTNASGNYTATGLRTGSYKVFFSATGYYGEWYNNKTNWDIANAVLVTAPAATSGINAVLDRSGSISGTVKNESGTGIKNVWVGIFKADGTYLFGTPTDQDGKYTASGLAAGNYKVFFNAPAGYRSEWYNNKKDLASANPVAVTVPKMTSGINAVLGAGGSIVGTVENDQGVRIANVNVQVFDLAGVWAAVTMTGANGSYTVNGLAAGKYKVFFSPPSGSGYSSEWYNNKASQASALQVTVTLSNTTPDIDAVLHQGGLVTMTSPNGGENWKVGSKYTIKWNYAGDIGDTVKIDLIKGDKVVKTIAGGVASGSLGAGSFTWTVPKTLAYAGNYRIAVTGNAKPSFTDVSDAPFAISGPKLDVASPDGGESWPRGSRHDITWTYTGNPGGTVRIQLLKGGVVLRTLTSNSSIGASGKGSFSWTVPQDLPLAANYRIKVAHAVIGGCSDTSNGNFGITKALATSSAGPDQKVAEAAPVKLSGANSSGFDRSKATFSWTQLDGPQAMLSSRSAFEPVLTAPEAGADGVSLMFRLTIVGEDGFQAQDSCIVNVTDSNIPPTAEAGPTRTVTAGSLVDLDGSASFDPDDAIASYSWKQIAGPQVQLSDSSRGRAAFIAPELEENDEVLIFELIVTDQGGLRAKDTCIVNVAVSNQPPQADAGENLSAPPGTRVVLDGSRSSDPDGNIVSYRWTQVMGQPVTLSNPEALQPSFILPSTSKAVDELVFELTVTDSDGLKDKKKVVVKAEEVLP